MGVIVSSTLWGCFTTMPKGTVWGFMQLTAFAALLYFVQCMVNMFSLGPSHHHGNLISNNIASLNTGSEIDPWQVEHA